MSKTSRRLWQAVAAVATSCVLVTSQARAQQTTSGTPPDTAAGKAVGLPGVTVTGKSAVDPRMIGFEAHRAKEFGRFLTREQLDKLQGKRLSEVLSKLSTALVVAPVIVIAVTIATQIVVLLLASVILMIGGASPAPIWNNLQLFQLTVALVFGQIAVVLWYAPVATWVLFVSSWAKRVPILWAVLTPIAIMLFERVAIGTHYVQDMLAYRLRDGLKLLFAPRSRMGITISDGNVTQADLPRQVFDALDPVAFFSNPWLWVGLIVAAGLVVATIWMRRYREPI
jgi:hypothetical protein